jgi:hypothetical protein
MAGRSPPLPEAAACGGCVGALLALGELEGAPLVGALLGPGWVIRLGGAALGRLGAGSPTRLGGGALGTSPPRLDAVASVAVGEGGLVSGQASGSEISAESGARSSRALIRAAGMIEGDTAGGAENLAGGAEVPAGAGEGGTLSGQAIGSEISAESGARS